MFEAITTYHLIIIFSVTIIISYFFNLYAKKSGIPAVLLLIGLGIGINYVAVCADEKVGAPASGSSDDNKPMASDSK